MRSSRRSLLIAGLLVAIAIAAPFPPSRAGCKISHDENLSSVSDGVIPRNISSSMGFDGLYDDELNGSGVIVAILDTGINGYHLDLQVGLNTASSLITVNESFVPSETPVDLDGHGTFVAGMLIGNGNSSSGSIVGMAPATEIWNVKVLDQNGEGEEAWLVNAIDWLLGGVTKPDIVSLSLGATSALPSLELKIKQLWNAGVVVICAAGNEGPDYYTINSPGTVLEAITVGACSDDEYLMAFSSEGPTYPEYFYKPEIVSFGLDVVSTHYSGGYAQGSGTSFSVPFIASGISLLMQATGDAFSPDEIKAAIVESSRPLGYSHFMDGAGLPNFTKALDLLENPGWDGWAILPGEIEFPIGNKEGTAVENQLEKWLVKATVINSRYGGDITVSLTGDIAGFTSVNVQEYDGGTDQFVIAIRISETSSAMESGTGTVVIKDGEGATIATITVTVTSALSSWIPIVIVGVVIAFIVGIVVTFAMAYRRGSRAMPYARCEIEGMCPRP